MKNLYKYFSLFSLASCSWLWCVVALCSEINVDGPERLEKKVEIKEGWMFAISYAPDGKSFVYVFKGNERKWKSPPMRDYFAMYPELRMVDVNANSSEDSILTSFTPHLGCIDYGGVLSMDGGEENYLIHIELVSNNMHNVEEVIVEASDKLPKEVISFVGKDLLGKCGIETEKLSDGSFRVLKKDQEELEELLHVYQDAMSLYAENSLDKAIETFQSFFDRHDYRSIDVENKNSKYTVILNDYAFVLQKKSPRKIVIPLFEHVLSRDPERIVTYLNMADTVYSPNKKQMGLAKPYYIKYHDMMIAAGKKDKIPVRVFERMK